MFSQFGSFLVTSPIMVIISLGFIINEVGWAGLIGFKILFFLFKKGVVLVFVGTFING